MLLSRHTRRREFIALVGGAAAWPFAVHAQQSVMPIVGFINGGNENASAKRLAAFRRGLSELGYTEGQNVAVEYHWLDGHYDRLAPLLADLVRRHVAVIATPASNPAALAAKTATATIPIVFGVGEDPVALGLVGNLSRPSGNATGINFFSLEINAKRLSLMHELLPAAKRFAVLVNPTNASSADGTSKDVQKAALSLGLETSILNASSPDEIDAAFSTLVREPSDALFVAGDGFFTSRAVQFATLAARDRMPASYASSEMVDAGLLMSYGVDFADTFRQVGNYVGRILKGEKPADLPIQQSTKFEFVINMRTAKALGLNVANSIQLLADEVIE
jgi:putative tryptophan/tyrosine transport system substrate-binding protein